jgi:hypothetical protein
MEEQIEARLANADFMALYHTDPELEEMRMAIDALFKSARAARRRGQHTR